MLEFLAVLLGRTVDNIDMRLQECYCLALGKTYYTDTGRGYTLDERRALRMRLEDAMALKQQDSYFRHFEIKAVPSIPLT